MAAEGGYVNIVEFLVDSGAEIDVKDNTHVSISLLAGPTRMYSWTICVNIIIRESVDSLCRDGADMQYMQYLRKSHITSPQIC